MFLSLINLLPKRTRGWTPTVYWQTPQLLAHGILIMKMFNVNSRWPNKQRFIYLLINCQLVTYYLHTCVGSNTIVFTNLAKNCSNINDNNYSIASWSKEIISCCHIKAWWECNKRSRRTCLTVCCCMHRPDGAIVWHHNGALYLVQ